MADPLQSTEKSAPEDTALTAEQGEQSPRQPEGFSADYVKSLREENKRRRIEAKELATKVETLNTNVKGLLLKAAFGREAVSAGIAHPEDAYKLANMSGVEIDDEHGSVTGIAEAIESLRENRPWLFRRQKPQPYGPETSLTGSAPSPLEAARSEAMKKPSVKNIARYQAELARARIRN